MATLQCLYTHRRERPQVSRTLTKPDNTFTTTGSPQRMRDESSSQPVSNHSDRGQSSEVIGYNMMGDQYTRKYFLFLSPPDEQGDQLMDWWVFSGTRSWAKKRKYDNPIRVIIDLCQNRLRFVFHSYIHRFVLIQAFFRSQCFLIYNFRHISNFFTRFAFFFSCTFAFLTLPGILFNTLCFRNITSNVFQFCWLSVTVKYHHQIMKYRNCNNLSTVINQLVAAFTTPVEKYRNEHRYNT